MNPVARVLVTLGIAFVAAGVFWQFIGRQLPLGRLPGDIVIDRPNMKAFFPITTSIAVSLLLSLVLWVLRRIKG
jgi:hypothetical protein